MIKKENRYNKYYANFLISIFFFIICVSFVSGGIYNNSCEGKLAWLENATLTEISKMKLVKYPDIVIDNFNTTLQYDTSMILYFPLKNDSLGDNDSYISNIINPNSNNGSIDGAIYENNIGRISETVLSFDGINDRVIVPYSQHINISLTGATMSAWIKFNNNPSTDIYTVGDYGDGEFTMGIVNSTKELACNYAGLTDSYVSSMDIVMEENIWYHIVCFYNGTDIGGYVNGILDDYDPATGNLAISTEGVNIGMRTDDTRWFNGSINQFVIYNRSLSQNEITKLYFGSNNGLWGLRGNDGGQYRLTNESKSGEASLNWTYNMSNIGYDWIQISTLKINAENHTGVGFWLKGDGSNNTLYSFRLKTNVTGSEQLDWSVDNFIVFLNETVNWRYIYIDFSQFNNKSTSGQYMNFHNINNIIGFVFLIDDIDGTNNYSSILIDNISFVDFDKGSLYYPRWEQKTTVNRNGRYQEAIYNLAYQYSYGGSNFKNNETILNITLNVGDWLVRNQFDDGGWQEDFGYVGSNPVHVGNIGSTFIKSLNMLKNEPRMNDNISTYYHGNISTRSRISLWNETAERVANYTLGFSSIHWSYLGGGPYYLTEGIWYSNQITSAIHSEWLYYNYSSNPIYLNDVNEKLLIYNSTPQLNNFGFLPEANSSEKLGFDAKYFMVGLVELSLLYLDYNSSLLGEIISKHDNLLLNSVGTNGSIYNINSTRNNYFTKDATDRTITKTAELLNLPYMKQMSFLLNNKSSLLGYGNSFNGATFTGTASFKAMAFTLNDYLYCSSNVENSGFKFPLDHKYYVFQILDNNALPISIHYNGTGNITTISENQYQRILYAYENNSFWRNNDYPQSFYLLNNSDVSNINIPLYSFSSTLIYTSNGSVACSDITNCDGNINITLAPNNYSYVLDNFNLTEGITREHSPLWFSSSTSTSKHIASNLTDTINATVVFNFDGNCIDISTISYTSHTGTYTNTYVAGQFTCSGNTITLDLEGIEPATNSNVLLINFNTPGVNNFCNNVTSGIPNFFSGFVVIFVLLAVGIIILILFGLVKVINGDELDLSFMEDIFEKLPIPTIFAIVLSITILVWLLFVTIGSLCS